MIDRNLHTLALGYRILGFVVIVGGLSLLGSMFGLFPAGRIFTIMFTGSLLPPVGAGLLGMWFAFLIDVAAAWILFEVARSLVGSRRRNFCLVIAWLVSARFPMGTVLGVFTIIQLVRCEGRAPAKAVLPPEDV